MKEEKYYNLYKNLPVFLQNLACSLYGFNERKIRFGKEFENYSNELLDKEFFSEGEIENYQNEQLRRLINHCYDNVPYYNELFKINKLRPSDIIKIEDLKKIPVLTKELIIKNFNRLQANNIKEKLVLKNTSGTTGKSLSFYTTKDAIAFQWAIWWRHRNRFGVKLNDLHINFIGKKIVPIEQIKPPFWRFNYPVHQILINMQHLKNENIPYIIDYLNSKDVIYYSGYPSIIYDFLEKADSLNIHLEKKPKFIFPGAENLLDYQKKIMTKMTNAVISQQYGFTEGCGNASQCENLIYHEDFEFGILECADETNSEGDRTGKIISTGFSNYAFPFIRYEVGDVGTFTDEKCKCGRHSKIIKRIEGRKDDFVITPEGNKIMRFDYIFKGAENIKECQIIQEKLGEITLSIVRRSNYNVNNENEIKDIIKEWISPSINVNFNYISAIEKSNNGKFKAVVNKLNNKN